ncbi:MAG: hypothetical protein WAU70_03130 [Flavobacteriales bacterium]
MNKSIPFIAALTATAIAVQSHAQTDTTSSGIGGSYTIEGNYNPTIEDARKIDLRPQLIDTILPIAPVQYNLINVQGHVPARVDSITAVKLGIQTMQTKLYKGYAKAGFGLYTTPLLELYYDQTRSRENAWGVHYKHLSSNGGIDGMGESQYSFNAMDAHYTHYLKKHEVGGSVGFDRRRISYYGGTDELALASFDLGPISDDRLKQVYNDLGFGVHVKSLYKDSALLAHDVRLEVHQYNNTSESKETNVKVTADLEMEQGSESYGGRILIDNNSYRAQQGTLDFKQGGFLLGLLPQVSTRSDNYLVQVGVGIYLDVASTDVDTLSDRASKTTFHFFPRVYLSYSLFDDIIVPYVGVDGARERNSLRSLTRENPWLMGSPVLSNSSKMYDLYGGIRGSVSSRLGFDVRVSTRRWKDKMLFLSKTDTILGDRFFTVYDQVDVLDISGELMYSAGENVKLNGRVDVYTNEALQQAEAWYMPNYRLALGGMYDIRNKLILKAEVEMLGARFAGQIPGNEPTFDTGTSLALETKELDSYFDLYLGAEYRYTKRFSIWVDVSNLGADKYERWLNHPVQRTLLMGGVTMAF